MQVDSIISLISGLLNSHVFLQKKKKKRKIETSRILIKEINKEMSIENLNKNRINRNIKYVPTKRNIVGANQ